MQQQPLDYRSPREDVSDTTGRALRAAAVSGAVIVVANLAVLAFEAANAGLGALGIAVTLSPLVNVTLIIIALARSPFVHKRLSGASILPYLLVSILLPVGAALFNVMMAHDIR